MNNPRYSILYCGFVLQSCIDEIDLLLKDGVKVLWFGIENDLDELGKRFPKPLGIRLLQVYKTENKTNLRIIDGDLAEYENDFKKLSSEVKEFNSEQYLVEHSRHRGIIVTASAGTGKTSVMVDRVLYLLHMGVNDPSRITMITFTNNATEQMMERLQAAVLERFMVTGNRRYVTMLEQASQVHISTIDSFAYRALRSIGTSIGYSRNLGIASDTLELKGFTRDFLDECYVEGKGVKDCFGVNMHEVSKLIRDFRNRLASLGVDMKNVDKLDWGYGESEEAKRLQTVLKSSYRNIELRLEEDRRRRNSVPLYGLSQEFNRSLAAYGNAIPDLGLDYLFVDEFQDTSDDQIRMVADLMRASGASLFVVGDPKQSIYRFRGADDSAFKTLLSRLEGDSELDVCQYSLVNNYRTDEKVLADLDVLFRKWIRRGLLSNYDRLIACSDEEGGKIKIKRIKRGEIQRRLAQDIREYQNNIKILKRRGDAVERRIAILVRANWQVEEVASICEKNRIHLAVRRDSPLFLSEAARDLYSLLSSYLHPGDPLSMFEYLCTPYSGKHEPASIRELTSYNGSKIMIQDYLYDILSTTKWEEYRNRFKMEPALSVLREILDETPLVENRISIMKSMGEFDQKKLKKDAEQYRRNLDRVMEILHSMFPQDGLDLSHICGYLETAIATNRDEMEPEGDLDVEDTVCCMTIHKSKGLEFDTVIIPYDKIVADKELDEILISEDRKIIGWKYKKESDDGTGYISNSNYPILHKEDLDRIRSEETRILYVALTRAKRSILVYTSSNASGGYSWTNLMEGS